jgi:hypothetical protein
MEMRPTTDVAAACHASVTPLRHARLVFVNQVDANPQQRWAVVIPREWSNERFCVPGDSDTNVGESRRPDKLEPSG